MIPFLCSSRTALFTDASGEANRDPVSPSLNTRAHGRVETVMFILKSVLVITFLLDTHLHKAVLIIVATTFGVVGFYMYVVYQPFYKPMVNRAHAAFFAAYCWACFCLIMLELRGKPQVSVQCVRLVVCV